MSEYRIKISGVHYGANGDSVAGQKDTAEMTARTLDLLRWVDRERQIVTLAPDPANPIHKDAIKARSRGRKIGRVAKEDVKKTWDLLRQSGKPMLMARVSEVVIKEHGYIVVTVDADELQPTMPATSPEVEWQQWMSDLPLLPPSELLEKEDEAAFMLDSLYMSNLDGADTEDLKFYLDLWTEGSRHDLSYEACQKRSEYEDFGAKTLPESDDDKQ